MAKEALMYSMLCHELLCTEKNEEVSITFLAEEIHYSVEKLEEERKKYDDLKRLFLLNDPFIFINRN